jgi:hypothetical protein
MMADTIANCLRCGRGFVRHRAGHIFCSRECRYAGEHTDRKPVDAAVVERLFDPARDPLGQVREDDWHPATGENPQAWRELDWQDTVESRKRWYLTLRDEGMV